MINQEVNIQVVLYIANKLAKLGIELSETKLYKLLRFTSLWMADNKWDLILQDVFIRKQFWPVPENISEYIGDLKISEGGKDDFIQITQECKPWYGPWYTQNTIVALQDYDEKYFTPNMKEALDETIATYAPEKASKLSDMSHSKAWTKADNRQLVDITEDMENESFKELVKEQYEDTIYVLTKLKYAF